MSVLNLFPARIRFVNPDGTLTPEALRLLEVLVQRVGGQLGDIGADVFAAPEAAAPGAMPDLVQQAPGGNALAELLLQAPAGRAAADLVQQLVPYSAGTGVSLADYRFSLKDTAVAPGTYGNATNVAKFTVDQQGRLTSAENVPISLSSANYSGSLTGKTVTIVNGIITSVV